MVTFLAKPWTEVEGSAFDAGGALEGALPDRFFVGLEALLAGLHWPSFLKETLLWRQAFPMGWIAQVWQSLARASGSPEQCLGR